MKSYSEEYTQEQNIENHITNQIDIHIMFCRRKIKDLLFETKYQPTSKLNMKALLLQKEILPVLISLHSNNTFHSAHVITSKQNTPSTIKSII